MMLAGWIIGGTLSIVGALCYAELASAEPGAGGDYHCLMRAFGPRPAFLYAWSRLAVIQSGSIALLAFIFGRSEEHTSELQSLMRISYAVFCLKKKKKTNTTKYYNKITNTMKRI